MAIVSYPFESLNTGTAAEQMCIRDRYVGNGFTFGLDDLDVVVLGECSKEITDSYTITQLLKDESKAATIYAAEDNTLRSLLKHWRIYAK